MTQAVALAQQASTGVSQGFKNRIINGAMVINQRGFSGAVDNTNPYTLDRWQAFSVNSSKYTVQQNAGSVTPPAGFTNYLGVTSSAATSVGASDYYAISQRIEGFNYADLNWGTANAKTITLSFWVRSSLTGQFGGSVVNGAGSYSYPFSFTINSANTWEYETITIAGPTAGDWIGATNATAIQLIFSLGYGSSLTGSAGSWQSAGYYNSTGSTNLVSTNGATFYLTGVQFEVGSTATSFDTRSYGTELVLCQRYCLRVGDGLTGVAPSTSSVYLCPSLTNPMRASPTTTLWDTSVQITDNYASDHTSSGSTLVESTLSAFGGRIAINGFSGLTAGRVYQAYGNTNGYVFIISAEL